MVDYSGSTRLATIGLQRFRRWQRFREFLSGAKSIPRGRILCSASLRADATCVGPRFR
jgi:hypothetical protein